MHAEVSVLAEEFVGRCGCCRCDLYPAYSGNVRAFADRQRVSKGWLEYFGLRLSPEEVGCDGCRGRAELMRTNSRCPIRSCVIQRGIRDCTVCDDLLCGKLKSLLDSVERAKRNHPDMSRLDYDTFIRPFDSRGEQGRREDE